MGRAHAVHDVGPQLLPEQQVAAQDLVDVIAKRPDLVVRAGLRGPVVRAPRLADAVQPADRREHAELEPAHDELAEARGGDVPALEAADVRGPPRNAGQPDVQPGRDLAPQVVERGVDVTGPDQRAVALAARPGGPAEQDDLVLLLVAHALEEALGVQQRVDVPDLQAGAEVVAQVARLLGPQLRLAGVQPPGADSVGVVAPLGLLPYERAGPGVGRVVVAHQRLARLLGVRDRQVHADALLVRDQQAIGLHLGVVVAQRVDRGPDRHHELHAEPVQLVHHGRRVRPLLGVELPVAHVGPVEVVGHDDRERQPAPLVLPGHAEQLVLVPVAELALPEAGRPVREHGRPSGHAGVPAQHVRGLVRGGDPVVPLAGGLADPPRGRRAQLDPADPRVVPQEAVTQAGHEERDGHLGVALDELDHGALLVQPAVLVLAEAVTALAVVRLEHRLVVVHAAAGGAVPARRGAGEVLLGLDQQLGAVGGAQKAQPAARGHLGRYPAVTDPGSVGGDVHLGLSRARRRAGRRGVRRGSPTRPCRAPAGRQDPRPRCGRFRAHPATPGRCDQAG